MPDFIIIGLPKCGTWWLSTQLKNHPKIDLKTNPWNLDKGEVRFFSKNFRKPINDYFKLFSDRGSGLKFEKSPDYCIMSISRIKFIKRLNPKIKILMLLRDPVSRAFSHAKMDILRNKGIGPENEILYKKHYETTSKIYNYETIIRRWSEVFGSNLLVLNFKKIYLNPESIIRKCFKFLQVEYIHDLWDSKPINQTEPVDLPDKLKEFIEKLNFSNIRYYDNLFSE